MTAFSMGGRPISRRPSAKETVRSSIRDKRRHGCTSSGKSAAKQARRDLGHGLRHLAFVARAGLKLGVPRVEDAAGGRSSGLGMSPGIGRKRRLQIIEVRQRVQQPAGVGVRRMAEDVAHRALLENAPQVHHRHPVGGLGDHAEIVGDEEDRHAELGDQLLHQVDHLPLDRHVERGRRLVGDQELGPGRERHGDHRALAHPARILEDVLVEAPRGLGDAHAVEHLDRKLLGLALAHRRGGSGAAPPSAPRH